jgi:hypothetical protein
MTAEMWTAVGTWASVVVMALTLVFVRGQVREAVRLRREQTRPYVVVSLDVEQGQLFMIVVENAGTSAAYDVSIEFDVPPSSALKEIETVRMLREPIPLLPPGRRYRAAWDVGHQVLDDAYPHPRTYRPTVRYHDHEKHRYEDTFVLDFNIYDGQALSEPGIPELVRAVEGLGKTFQKWTDGTRGLLTHNIDIERQRRRTNRPSHIRRASREWQEKGPWAAIMYWIDLWRRRYGWLRGRR